MCIYCDTNSAVDANILHMLFLAVSLFQVNSVFSGFSSGSEQFYAIALRTLLVTNECCCHYFQQKHQMLPPFLVQYL